MATQRSRKKYPETEKSFRQTICSTNCSDRGFQVIIDHINRKVQISFDSTQISPRHAKWMDNVRTNIGLDELNPQPYWGFDDLAHKAGTKLLNCFYVQADAKRENGVEYFHYNDVTLLRKFSFEGFLNGISNGNILIDIDARTGHNHGTKFRLRQNYLPYLYEEAIKII